MGGGCGGGAPLIPDASAGGSAGGSGGERGAGRDGALDGVLDAEPDAEPDAAPDASSAAGDGSATLPNGKCVPGAFEHDGVCACQPDTATVCHQSCTDVTIDPDNCGVCGRACAATATCNGGRCGPPVTNVVPAAPGCGALDIAIGGGVLYWTDQRHGTVRSQPVGGGASRTIASAEASPGLVAISGSNLFWISVTSTTPMNVGGVMVLSTTAKIRTATVQGGAARDLVTETNLNGGIRGLVVSDDGTVLYYSADTKVRAVPVSGGTAVDVGREEMPASNVAAGIPTALAVAGNTIAFVTDVDGDVDVITVGNSDGLTASCGKDDLRDPTRDALLQVHCTRVAQGQYAPLFGALLLRGGDVIWANDSEVQTGSAMQVASGINLGGIMAVATTEGAAVTGLVADSNNIYFADGEDGLIDEAPSAPNADAIPIARGQMAPGSMAIDATRVYWSTGDCAINATGSRMSTGP